MKYDSGRKLARNAALYEVHLMHPEMTCEQLAKLLLPWGKISRQRVHLLLGLERKRRELARVSRD